LLQTVPDALLTPAALPVFFLGLWVIVCGLVAVVGGWQTLSGDYRAPDDFILAPEDRLRMRSIQLRTVPLLPTRYGACITIGTTPRGLYLHPSILLRPFHPPLLIPWAAVEELTDGHFIWSQWTDVGLRGTDTRIRLFGRVGDLVRSKWQTHRSGMRAEG
jgi:hypothetical protein